MQCTQSFYDQFCIYNDGFTNIIFNFNIVGKLFFRKFIIGGIFKLPLE